MRKVNVLLGFSVVAILLFSLAHAGVVRVEVCHRPPGKDIWQTITVPEKILSNHLAHGDLAGSCDDNIDTLCDDGNFCTVDVDYDNLTCLQEIIPVDCDDGNLCTIDSCDELTGCVSEPVICDDGNLCTISQCASDTGECVHVPIVCGLNEECNEDTGTCMDDGSNLRACMEASKETIEFWGLLPCNNSNITSLEGIQDIGNLTGGSLILYLQDNRISDITPLKDLNISVLLLDHNQISDVTPLQNQINLEVLDLRYNCISDFTPINNLPMSYNFQIQPQNTTCQ